ncbi:MAG: peptidoglycan-binding protein [Deltaproteobacteria bacterium]|nr:peptidoglycan-binding protein [Kofleriaceae bacterium]
MELLRQGSRGAAVRLLQLQLRALGYDVGDIDGIFGARTRDEVLAFQRDTDAIDVDGIVGAETVGALAQALVMKETEPFHDAVQPQPPQVGAGAVAVAQALVPCDAATWQDFTGLVDTLTGRHTDQPVKYGPGRGLFRDGRWIVTKGPGRLDSTAWSSAPGGTYASFHCSSFTNFFLGWLLRYDEDYTHAGNIPSLFEICEQPNLERTKPGVGRYRGYGPFCRQILTSGATRARNPHARGLDIQELFDRRRELPTFLVCGQSSRRADGTWRLWHHTVLFVIDHAHGDRPMFRIAADGTKHKETKRWSGRAMEWIAIDDAWIAAHNARTYFRPYGVISLPDGSYDHLGTGPRPEVILEA